MVGMLIAYDAAGNVVATLEALVQRDGDDFYLVDFEAHEQQGRPLDSEEEGGLWHVPAAVGSGHWPEWLGAAAHDFTVELDEDKRIVSLVGKANGSRRERADIEQRIAKRRKDTPAGEPVDLRSIVGGPDKPLLKANRPR